MKHIYKCPSCSAYTMKEVCPACGEKAIIAKPLKYSPEDKLAPYRRSYKSEHLKKVGLL